MEGMGKLIGTLRTGLWHGITAVILLAPVLIGDPVLRPAPGRLESLSIYEIQYTEDPSGDSPYVGQQVTVSGVVTGVFYDGYVIADAPSAWNALFVYSMANAPEIGDEIELSGTVAEYYGMTEITDVTSYQQLSAGNAITPINLDAASAPTEAYESTLIEIDTATVIGLEDYGEWIIHDGTGSLRCDDMNDSMYFPQIGDQLDSLTGILFYSFGDYTLEPRDTADISGEVIP